MWGGVWGTKMLHFFISFHSLNLFNLHIFDPLYQKGSDESENVCVYLFINVCNYMFCVCLLTRQERLIC